MRSSFPLGTRPAARRQYTSRTAPFPQRLEPRLLWSVYTLVDLGTLGGDGSYAEHVNNNDVVVGYARTAAGDDRAFQFRDVNGNTVADAGEMQNLGTLPGDTASYATGINDAGVVVGVSATPDPLSGDPVRRAVRFAPSGPVDLGLGAGSTATAINAAGTVVGGATTLEGRFTAYLRTAAGEVTYFGENPAYALSEATGINDAGVITGYAKGTLGDAGFARRVDGTTEVVSFPQPASPFSYAWDVNSAGQIAGEGFDAAGTYSAFRVEPDGSVTAIGTLAGYAGSEASGINDAGEVVGRAVSASGSRQRAILFSGGVLYDLNDLIPSSLNWRLTDARAINDKGSVVGYGIAPDGQTRAFLLKRSTVGVRGRFVFYNDSAFDGDGAAASAADNAAVAFNKQALLPGQTATFANYTSYAKGINGILVDLPRAPGAAAPVPADFSFRVGNDNNPAGWAPAPPPSAVAVRPGGGIGGSDRVTLTWADGAATNRWLQVTVRANARTGLAAPDTFYFGNAPGETGDRSSRAEVGPADIIRTRRAFGGGASPSNRYDHNRDGRVDFFDMLVVRRNLGRGLQLIAPPAAVQTAGTVAPQPSSLLLDSERSRKTPSVRGALLI